MWNAYSSAAAVKWVLLLFMLGRAWLCSIMGCSAPGSPVLTVPQSLLTFMSSQWCYLTVSSSVAPFFSCPQSFPASRSFPISLLFASGGQSIETSASASVLPMKIQDWFPLGLTDLISLQSKGLSKVFSSTTVQKHQYFSAQLSLWSTLTSIHDYWKNHSFEYVDLCWQSNVFASRFVGLSNLDNTLFRFS